VLPAASFGEMRALPNLVALGNYTYLLFGGMKLSANSLPPSNVKVRACCVRWK